MASISLRDVEKRFGDVTVLRDCSLEIADHDFIVLVGPSGSGKTTLLRIIAGLEHASGGEVWFGDVCVNDLDVSDRDIAMVFQNYGLYPHMSVYDNMAFGLRRRKLPKDEIDRRVRHAAGMLSIEPYLTRRPKQLSGGQRQRVALGRAIVRDPAVFLLDEPLSNLDAQLRVQMRAEILKVHRSVTATAVYVTHDQVEAMTMGDRIVVMHEGRIQQVGTPDELYDHPVNLFVASFIGTPPMGFATCRVDRGGDGVRLNADAAAIRLPAEAASKLGDREEVVVGIRPENLTLADAGQDMPVLFRGRIEVVEMLGAEQLVHFSSGGESLTAKLPRGIHVKLDEEIAFAADARHLHFFDKATGATLR
jgi:multiple sugar transport system ATP-binding protein